MGNAVVTVVRSVAEVELLVTWSARLAQILAVPELQVVHLSGSVQEETEIDLDAPMSAEDPVGLRVRAARKRVVARATPRTAEGWHPGDPIPDLTLIRLPLESTAAILERAAASTRLLVIGEGEGTAAELEANEVILRRAACEVFWLHFPGEPCKTGHILASVAGGPHAELVLERAAGLAVLLDGKVDALLVQPAIGRDSEAVGARRAREIVDRAGLRHRDRISIRVAIGNDPVKAINDAYNHGDYELALIGASPVGSSRRARSKRIPENLRATTVGFGVVRKEISLRSRLVARGTEFFRETVPQLDRESRIGLTAQLTDASSWSFDFRALVFLSTLIASLGLLQNSGAVVIGAMLVAPLMTPLITIGFGLVQGNWPLARTAAASLMFGFGVAFTLAIGLGLVARMGWLDLGTAVPAGTPDASGKPDLPTGQMNMRGSVGIADFAIALASGIAAAYVTARPRLSGALAGVAIAAALVPPIATSGMALALGDFGLSRAAMGLFLCNIFAIMAGSAISLFAVGLRIDRRATRPWNVYAWAAMLACALGIAWVL